MSTLAESTGNPIQDYVVAPLKDFVKESQELMKITTYPDVKEFVKSIRYTALGLVLAGFVGFGVKLLALPVKHILIG